MGFKIEGKKRDRENRETPPREKDLLNITEIDSGILQYVRERMHCKTVTQEVRRQAAAFEREMSRMQGW